MHHVVLIAALAAWLSLGGCQRDDADAGDDVLIGQYIRA